MLVTLGARVPTGGDAIDDLLACHARIRKLPNGAKPLV